MELRGERLEGLQARKGWRVGNGIDTVLRCAILKIIIITTNNKEV